MTEVVVRNKSTYKRKDGDYPIYIHRGYTLGNPFRIGLDGTREEVIDKFKNLFLEKISSDTQFRRYVDTYKFGIKTEFCKRLVLLCYCHPKPCHGDIIKEYLTDDTSC